MMRRLVLALAGCALALTACSTSTSVVPGGMPVEPAQVTPSGVPAVPIAPDGQPRTVAFRSTLQSSVKDLHTAGPQDQVTYGWNNLVGPTVFDDQPAQTQMQGNVWYVSGTGPFYGFVTLTFADGSTLGLSMQGAATKSGGTSSFASDLVVIGGTGRYSNAAGSGSWTGSRSGVLGSAVQFDGTLTLVS